MKKLLTCPSQNIFSMVEANSGLVVVALATLMRVSYCSKVYKRWLYATIFKSNNTYRYIRVKKGGFAHLTKLVQNFFHLVVVFLVTLQLHLRNLNLQK